MKGNAPEEREEDRGGYEKEHYAKVTEGKIKAGNGDETLEC